MKLKFLGVRGSRPVHKDNLLGFGGNSTSMEFVFDEQDFMLFLDGGSGMAHKGMSLGSEADCSKYHILITHTHWDHLLGLPYFAPLYNSKNKINFYSSKPRKVGFDDLFLGLHRAQNLPIPIDGLKANTSFITVKSEQKFTIENNVNISCYQINHQGITLSYRVEHEKSSVAIVTDHAPIEHENYLGEGMADKAKSDPKLFEREFIDGLIKHLKNCHTVVFDTHFTEDNLKPDWGHSTPPRALDICIRANVSRLILFHHAPEDTDQDVRNKVESVIEEGKKHGIDVVAAREGDIWQLF